MMTVRFSLAAACVAVLSLQAFGALPGTYREAEWYGLFPTNIRHICVVAPCSQHPASTYNAAKAKLEEAGYTVTLSPEVTSGDGTKEMTAEQKAAYLTLAWQNPDYDLIIAIRGGGGGAATFGAIDPSKLTREVPFIGFSNISCLLNPLEKRGVKQLISGPSLGALYNYPVPKTSRDLICKLVAKEAITNSVRLTTKRALARAVSGKPLGGHWPSIAGIDAADLPDCTGRIVFLEINNIDLTTAESRFTALKGKWNLNDAAAIVIGEVLTKTGADEMIQFIADNVTCPVYSGYPMGHQEGGVDFYAVDFGRYMTLTPEGVITYEDVGFAPTPESGDGDAAVVCDGLEREVAGSGEIAQVALDLSDVWDKRDLDGEPILWSSLGWEDVAEEEVGKSVTLQFFPLWSGEGQTLGSGLKGHRQVFNWTPGEVMKQGYVIRHVVVGGSPLDTDLNAYFSFENYDHVAPNEADVRAAIRSVDGTGWDFGIVNDAENWWELAGGPGEGIEAPLGASSFAFIVNGRGTFKFDYVLEGGTWTIVVDGKPVGQLDAASVPTNVELPLNGSVGVHTIGFSTVLSEEIGFAIMQNVRWVDEDYRVGLGKAGACPVDLREGVLVVRRATELMPFTWSATNFTGNAMVKDTGIVQIGPASVASVRVVQVTGDGEDVAQWATEVADTEKVLVAEKPGESTVRWRGAKPGVWKAELSIRTGGEVVHAETRVLDLRRYVGPGLMLILK